MFCVSLQNKSEGAHVNTDAAQPMSAPIRPKTGKRSARRQPYGWLGAGALTVGVGVALAGAGVAHADDAAAPTDSATSVTASPTAGMSRGAAVRSVGGRAATTRTANTRVAAATVQRRSAVLAPVGGQVAVVTAVNSPSGALVASTAAVPAGAKSTIADLWVAAAQVAALARPGIAAGAPRVEKVFGPGAFKSADFGPMVAPVMWALTEAAYQIQGLKPLAKPFQLPSAPGQAQVVGTLNTVAPFGAPVTFAVTKAPANGTVTIDRQGFYTYTPNAALAASGGTDTFAFTATDTGLHFETLFGLPGHTTTMVVPVTVAPQSAQAQAAKTTVTFHMINTSLAAQTFEAPEIQTAGVVMRPGAGLTLQTTQSTDFRFTVDGTTFQVLEQYIDSSTLDGAPGPSGTLAWNNDPFFTPYGSPGPFDINYFKNGPLGPYFSIYCEPKAGSCSANWEDILPLKDMTFYVADAPGTVYTVPAQYAQQQSDLLQNLVADDLSNAKFYPKSQPTIGYTNPLIPNNFTPYINNTTSDNQVRYAVTTTTSETDSTTYGVSVSVGAKAKMGALGVSASTTATQTWGTSFTDTFSYSETTIETVRAGESLYLYTETPVLRYYGDWSVLYGNTTYIMNDVWYDTPYAATGAPSYLAAYTCQTGSQQCFDTAQGKLSSYENGFPATTFYPDYPVAESQIPGSYEAVAVESKKAIGAPRRLQSGH
jgi:hypothetical protein